MASPTSTTQQKSAKEAREEFDTKMLKLVSRLEARSSILFYKRVSKCMVTEAVQGPLAYSLEFPKEFIDLHSKKFGKDATFMTTDTQQTWPIEITIRCFERSRSRVFAYGRGGWKAFVIDNRIKVGDFLIFGLISFSRFQVLIGRSPVGIHAHNETKENQDKLPAETSSCSLHNI